MRTSTVVQLMLHVCCVVGTNTVALPLHDTQQSIITAGMTIAKRPKLLSQDILRGN